MDNELPAAHNHLHTHLERSKKQKLRNHNRQTANTEKKDLNSNLIPFPRVLKSSKKQFVSDKISINFPQEFLKKAEFLKKGLSQYSNIEFQMNNSDENISTINIQLIQSH